MARVRKAKSDASEDAAPPVPVGPSPGSDDPEVPVTRKASGASRRRAAPLPPVSGPFSQVGLILGLAVCAFLGVALMSYHQGDPSFSTTASGPVRNLAGPVGAVLADALFQAFGYTAWGVIGLAAVFAVKLAGRPVGGPVTWLALLAGGSAAARAVGVTC